MKEGAQFSRYQLLWVFVITISAGWTFCSPTTISSRRKVAVPAGGDVTFSCDIGDHKNQWVRWDRLDTGYIVAMETHVLISDPRLSVGLWENNTWTLSITNVQEEDQGTYRCEVNSQPSAMQEIFLEVLAVPRPPSIIRSSPNTSIEEGGTLTLKCEVKGYPKPTVTWTRDDHEAISLRPNAISVPKRKELSFVGEVLKLPEVSRSDAGPYRCIADNSIDPVATRVIQVDVTFKPHIAVATPLVVVPLGSEVKVNCTAETLPMSLIYWTRNSGNMLFVGEDYAVREKHENTTVVKMTLIIKNLQKHHVGDYFCVAENKYGKAAGKVEVFDFKPESEALQTARTRETSKPTTTVAPQEPERKDIALDINPKRGQEKVDSSSSKTQTESVRMRPSYYNMVSFLRFFGLLMSFY